MAAFAASDVTVTITDRWIAGGKVNVVGTIAFGDGALTYPTAGIPLPAIAKFGMPRRLQVLNVYGVNERTSDYMVRYGPANHTLLLYEEEASAAGGPLLEADTSEAPAARTYSYHAIGD
jgi:hypothetical protein